MVHCFQGNCEGTAPGGLIEGIADFVRLKAGLSPPHWNRAPENRGRTWDEGYQKTAWFLEWLEQKRGLGTVSYMNHIMRRQHKYHEESFWKGIFGVSVDKLWSEYKETWGKSDQGVAPATGKQSSGAESEAVASEEKETQVVVMDENRKPKKFIA